MSDTIRLPLSVATRLCAELDASENADTPESNKAERMAFSSEYMVPTEVARRLERERDETRAWAEKVERNACQHSIRAEAAERERDEAREALRELWQSADAYIPSLDPECVNRWRKIAGLEAAK